MATVSPGAATIGGRVRGRARRALQVHRRGLATVAAAAIVAATVVATWFEAGTFFATGDVGPFLRAGLGAEIGALWSHAASGAGGAGYTIVRLPELAFIGLARTLGGGEPLAERLFYGAMFGWAAFGGATLLRRFTHHPALITGGGVLAAFNLFTLSALPNYLPVVAIGVVGVVTAIAVDVAHGMRRRRTLVVVAATLPLSYVALNPPLTAVVVTWSLLLPLTVPALTGTGRAGARALGRAMLWWAPWVLGAHLWWIVPQVLAVSRARAADAIGAQTDVTAWAWTHANNSFANVMTMRSAWTWPVESYHGMAAAALGRPGVAWLTWLMPLGLALAPLLVRGRRRRLDALVLGCVLCWSVGKGLHEPAAFLNRWAYELVPGAWLLREPMSKIGMLPLLGMLIAWAAVVAQLWRRSATAARPAERRAMAALAALLVAGPLVLTWPMVTGRVTHDRLAGRDEQVVVPDAWFDLAAAVDASDHDGKLLVLPLVDFYQMPTTWGFYGTDTLVRGLVSRPTLVRNPQGYVTDVPAVDRLVRAVEDALEAGDGTVVPVLRALGVGQVLVRRDFDTTSPIRSVAIADADRLIDALGETAGLTLRRTTDIGVLFEVDGGVPPVQAQRGALRFDDWDDPGSLRAALAGAPDGYALTDDAATASGRLWIGSVGDPDPFDLDVPAGLEVTRRGVSRSPYRIDRTVDASASDAGHRLRFVEVSPPTIGPVTLSPRVAADVSFDHEPVAVLVDGELVPIDAGAAPTVELGAASVVRPVFRAGTPGLGPLGPVGDCHRHDDRDPALLDLTTDDEELDGALHVRLAASGHRACRRAPLVEASGGTTYHLVVESRSAAGADPSLCLWLRGPDRCAGLPGGAVGPDGWRRLDTTVTLPDGTHAADLYLYADAPPLGVARTVTEYRITELSRWVTGPAVRIDATGALREAVELPAGAHVVGSDGRGAPAVGPWSEIGDCHRTDDRSLSELGLSATTLAGDGVRVDADHHIGCVHAAVGDLREGRRYELRLTHRTVRGARPRICVFEPGERQCVDLDGDVGPGDRLAATPEPVRSRVRFTAPAAQVELYVYADSVPGGTSVEYRDVAVRPSDDEIVGIVQLDPRPPTDAVEATARADGPSRFRVSVADRGRTLLTTSEAYDRGWEVRGLPEGASARHVLVDGYRNGWLLDTPTAAQLTIAYAPDRHQQRAILLSLVVLTTLAAGTGLRLVAERSHHADLGLAEELFGHRSRPHARVMSPLHGS